jgi:hypothetical protein
MVPPKATPSEPASSENGKAASVPPRRSRLRRWLRRIFRLFLILFVLLIVFIALFPTLISSRWLQQIGIKQTEKFLQRPVSLDRFRMSWAGRMEVADFQIGPLADEPDQPLFAIRKAHIRWAWKPLFAKKVRIEECSVEGFRLTVAKLPGDTWNLLRLVPPAPPGPAEPTPPPPPKPPGPPLEELPLEALHVTLNDWRIDYVDNVSTLPIQAAFIIDQLHLDLPSPAQPLTMDMLGGVELGKNAVRAPINSTLRVTPGPGGYLAWKQIVTEATLDAIGQAATLHVSPPPEGKPGVVVEATWRLNPEALTDFAARGLDMHIPASASGTLDGHMRAAWDMATSAGLTVQSRWEELTVRADALGTRTLPLADWNFGLHIETDHEAPAGTLPFSAWRLGRTFVESPFIAAEVTGHAEGLGKGLLPRGRLDWRVAHRPESLEPVLAALGIALPPQMDILQSVKYDGKLEFGLLEPIVCVGLAVCTLAPPQAPEKPLRLAADHRIRYDLHEDRLSATLRMGEIAHGLWPSGMKWREPLWIEVTTGAHPLKSGNRAGDLHAIVRPEPAMVCLGSAGLVPTDWETTGVLSSAVSWSMTESGDISTTTNAHVWLFVRPSPAPEAKIPEPLRGLAPLVIDMPEAQILFQRPADGRMAMTTTGRIALQGGWKDPVKKKNRIKTSLELPVTWTMMLDMPPDKPLVFGAQVHTQPHFQLAGPADLDLRDSIELNTLLNFDLATQSLHLDVLRVDVGDWATWRTQAIVEALGRERIFATSDFSMQWGEDLLKYLPEDLRKSLKGLAWDGRTSATVRAEGCWDPERPEEPIHVRVVAGHVFDRLTVGPMLLPLVRGRDWSALLRLDASASPARPVQPFLLDTSVRLGHVDSLAMVALDDIAARVSFGMDPSPPGPMFWNVQSSLGQVQGVAGPLPYAVGPFMMGMRGAMEMHTGAVEIEEAWLDWGDMASVRATAHYTSATQTFGFRAAVEIPSLSPFMSLPLRGIRTVRESPSEGIVWSPGPEAATLLRMLEKIPDVQGHVGMGVHVGGRVPTVDEIKNLDIPIQSEWSVRVDDLATTVAAPVVFSLQGIHKQLQFTTRGASAALDTVGRMDSLNLLRPARFQLLGSNWRALMDVNLAEGRASWDRWQLFLPELGLSFRADGGISGWGDIVRQMMNRPADAPPEPFDGVEMMRGLPARTEAQAAWSSTDWMTFAPTEARARGEMAFYAKLHQEPGREVHTRLGMSAENFEAAYGSLFSLKGVTGSLDLLISGRRHVAAPATPTFLSDRLFAGATGGDTFGGGDYETPIPSPVRPEQSTTLRIEEIVAGPWVLRGLTLRSLGDVRDWTVTLDCDDFMGGKLRGTMEWIAAADGGWDFGLEAELTGMSARSAIPAWRDLSLRETEISGLGRMRWHIAPTAQTPAELLQGMEMEFVVTHIGTRALEGFLLAMDPMEKNPAFVSARGGLRFGTPDYMRFAFRYGLMDMEIGLRTFAGIRMTMPLLKRAPVGEAIRLEALQPKLEAVQSVRLGLDALLALDDWSTPPGSAAIPAR